MQGANFRIQDQGGSATEAHLVHVNKMSSGGYDMYQFSFAGQKSGPTGDGMYNVSGEGIPETELFLVAQAMPDSEIAYVASITCMTS